MTRLSHSILPVAIAAGLAASAATDGALVARGAGHVDGVPIGLPAAVALVLLAFPAVRLELASNAAPALLGAGVAWTLAPLVDQHVTQTVVLDGFVADLVHHVAGWAPLLVAAQLRPAQRPVLDA